MQAPMTLQELLIEVDRQTQSKKDFVTNTRDNVRLIDLGRATQATASGSTHVIAMELLRDGQELIERLDITEYAHQQIASRLQIPWKYYKRLLADHPDLVIDQVNTLFYREPQTRLFRVLDGKVRAFLSDRYLRVDNHQVLQNTLPAVLKGSIQTKVLSTNVTENRMDLKVLFTDSTLEHKITTARGVDRVVHPGFRISNSETGQGSLRCDAFFFDDYCENGCVFGKSDLVSFQRNHLGAKLQSNEDFEIESDVTKQLGDKYIMSAINDVIKALSSQQHVAAMVDRLRSAATSTPAAHPLKAAELAVKQLDLSEKEGESLMETFMRDGDFTQYGLSAAVTEIANKSDIASYNRANELETIGGQIIDLNPTQWKSYVEAA